MPDQNPFESPLEGEQPPPRVSNKPGVENEPHLKRDWQASTPTEHESVWHEPALTGDSAGPRDEVPSVPSLSPNRPSAKIAVFVLIGLFFAIVGGLLLSIVFMFNR